MLNIPSIHVPKAADVLADLLREKILSGKIVEGTDLPNERELGEQTGQLPLMLQRAATQLSTEVQRRAMGLAGNDISALLRDGSGAMWVSGYGLGLQHKQIHDPDR